MKVKIKLNLRDKQKESSSTETRKVNKIMVRVKRIRKNLGEIKGKLVGGIKEEMGARIVHGTDGRRTPQYIPGKLKPCRCKSYF